MLAMLMLPECVASVHTGVAVHGDGTGHAMTEAMLCHATVAISHDMIDVLN